MAQPGKKEINQAKAMMREVAGRLSSQENLALYRYWLLQTLLVPIERAELATYGITKDSVADLDTTGMELLLDKSKILKQSSHRGELGIAWETAQRRSLVLSGVNKVVEDLLHKLDDMSGDLRLTVTDKKVIFERGDDESVLEDRLYVRQEVIYKGVDSVRLQFATSERNGLDLRLGWGSQDNWINTYCSINEPGDLPRYTEISQTGDLHDRAWESVASGYYFAIVSTFGWEEDRWAAELVNTACGGNPFGVEIPWANPVS